MIQRLTSIPRKYFYIAAMVLFLVYSWKLYDLGYTRMEGQAAQAQLEIAMGYAQALVEEQQENFRISQELEVEKEREKIVYRTIQKEVTKYVQTHATRDCLDAIQLQLINAAATGTDLNASSPDGEVPGSGNHGEGARSGGNPNDGELGGEIPGLPAEAPKDGGETEEEKPKGRTMIAYNLYPVYELWITA